jgi:hypothetical protein
MVDDWFEVDAIAYDLREVTLVIRDLFEYIDDHACTKNPGFCGFDAGADYRAIYMKAENLPTEGAVSDAHRWRPGDPIYIGRSS